MKALLIDPEKQTVSFIDIEKDLKALYKEMNCNMVEAPIEFKNGDTLWCDEEGKLQGDDVKGGFTFVIDFNQYIEGRCIITGTTKQGNMTNCKSTPEYFYNSFRGFKWVSKEEAIIELKKMGLY